MTRIMIIDGNGIREYKKCSTLDCAVAHLNTLGNRYTNDVQYVSAAVLYSTSSLLVVSHYGVISYVIQP